MAVKVPNLSMSNIKDVIYIIGIVITVFFYFRDKATKQAVLETKIETMLENQRSILEKFKETDAKFNLNDREHGAYSEHIRTSSR